MNKAIIFVALVVAMLFVAGMAGCRQAATDDSQQMESNLSDLESLDKDLGSIDSEINDSGLADVENLL